MKHRENFNLFTSKIFDVAILGLYLFSRVNQVCADNQEWIVTSVYINHICQIKNEAVILLTTFPTFINPIWHKTFKRPAMFVLFEFTSHVMIMDLSGKGNNYLWMSTSSFAFLFYLKFTFYYLNNFFNLTFKRETGRQIENRDPQNEMHSVYVPLTIYHSEFLNLIIFGTIITFWNAKL